MMVPGFVFALWPGAMTKAKGEQHEIERKKFRRLGLQLLGIGGFVSLCLWILQS